MGQIITFYSYKGGIGRTMALANVAVLLSQWGYKTLIVDWDLEAPGLDFFFKDYLDLATIKQQAGILDILLQITGKTIPFDWRELLVTITTLPDSREPVHFLTAGNRDETYNSRLHNLNIDVLYEAGGGFAIEQLRNEWKQTYDFILVDSRTGITDIGGVCTIHLPDMLLLLFSANEQSLRGVVEVAEKAKRARWKMPVDRLSLVSIPIPGKFDSTEEFKESQQWLDRFAQAFQEIYANWLPTTVRKRDFLQITRIPYMAYFSFGEKLPVIEQGTVDPGGLGYAYENIAALIASHLESVDLLLKDKSTFLKNIIQTPPADDTTSQSQSSETPEETTQTTPPRPLRVVLVYAPPDRPKARDLYKNLQQEGMDVWFDEEKLKPGQRIEPEIARAIRKTDTILVLLSENPIPQTQRTMVEDVVLFGDQVIPVNLGNHRQDFLSELFSVNLFFRQGAERNAHLMINEEYQHLLHALKTRAEEVGAIPPFHA